MAVGEERTTVGAAVVETGVVVREPAVCESQISITNYRVSRYWKKGCKITAACAAGAVVGVTLVIED